VSFHLGTLRLSDPISSCLSANKTIAVATLKTSVGFSSKANSPVSIKLVESKKSIVDPLDEIMENFDLKESLDQSLPDFKLEENSDSISNILKRSSPPLRQCLLWIQG
jgi:hypothetical protein